MNRNWLAAYSLVLSLLLLALLPSAHADDQYHGKVAIITGSSSGLGAELAKVAADRRMKLVLVDIKPEPSQAFAAEVRKRGGQAVVVRVDLAKPEERPRVIEAAVKEFGRIDYLFNNAGYAYLASLEQTDLQQAHHLFEVNYWAYVDLANRVVPIMKKQGGGTILNVASVAAHGTAPPGVGHYAATKRALLGLFLGAAEELKQHNIRVFVASPGMMRTNVGKNAVGPMASQFQGGWDKAEPPEIVARDIFAKMQGNGREFFPGEAGKEARPGE